MLSLACAIFTSQSVVRSLKRRLARGEEMTFEFEVFDKKSAPSTKEPWVTIQRKGLLSLNRAAAEALGTPEAVELLFDRNAQIVGFRPAELDSPRAFPMRKQGRNPGRNANYLVGGSAFCKYYNIDTSIARRYKPEMNDNVLTVDLKQDYAIATGPRTKVSEEA